VSFDRRRDGSSRDPARATLDAETAERVRRLGFSARRAVDGLLSGLHRSALRGASVVFVEHRDYRPGDDLRLLDWRAFARTDKDVVKRFEHEAQLKATLVLDRSRSMDFAGDSAAQRHGLGGAERRGVGPRRIAFDGARGRSPLGNSGAGPKKIEHAASLLAALAYLLVTQGDAVGAALVNHGLDFFLPAKSRPAQLDRVLRSLATGPSESGVTDLKSALLAVAERAGRRGVVVVASDLLDFGDDALTPLSQIRARGNDVIVLQVLTPEELELPYEAPSHFVGLEDEPSLDADPAQLRAAYKKLLDEFLDRCRKKSLDAGAIYALARTDAPLEDALATVLRARSRGGLR
jgi:uncharacterized protein (DUF58 family)